MGSGLLLGREVGISPVPGLAGQSQQRQGGVWVLMGQHRLRPGLASCELSRRTLARVAGGLLCRVIHGVRGWGCGRPGFWGETEDSWAWPQHQVAGLQIEGACSEHPLPSNLWDLQSLTLTSAHLQADVTSSRGTCHGLFTGIHTCSCLGQSIPRTARSKL